MDEVTQLAMDGASARTQDTELVCFSFCHTSHNSTGEKDPL